MEIHHVRFVLATFLFLAAASAGTGGEPLAPDLFVTSDRCLACHNGLITPSGEDASIGVDWRSSMMANSARDPYWQAAVRRETLVHPGARAAIEDKCGSCHMPMARYQSKAEGRLGEVFAHLPIGRAASSAGPLAADGVSCAMCHQIRSDEFGEEESFTAGFVVDTTTAPGQREAFGPFEVDPGRTRLMQSASRFRPAEAAHTQESELCATCHTLYTHALDREGRVVGEFPEQTPYLEWLHSSYPGDHSCQSCHMPVVEGEMAISGVLGLLREEVSRHVFRGGNFFMPRILNAHRGELGVEALPQEMEVVSQRTAQHLATSSAELSIDEVEVSGGSLSASVTVRNLAGHKLPSAYPSRRAWIHFTIRDVDGSLLFESGRLEADGSIAGNDNDADPGLFEPHYDEIDDAAQVQIYEPILAASDGTVTTVLISAASYVKDNRMLPDGFDKTTADDDIAVYGRAADDGDFLGGGDRVRYSVELTGARGPLTIEAELLYQPIGYRWAQNLGDTDAPEIDRFIGLYDSMAGESATVLAHDMATTR
jgi:hypothetical protein